MRVLQIQMRDFPGFVDTRHQLLQLKASVKGHWLGLAVAHHLNGNHTLAVQILKSFQDTQEEVPDNEQYEQSEVLMYKAMVLREGGALLTALQVLQECKVWHIGISLSNHQTPHAIAFHSMKHIFLERKAP